MAGLSLAASAPGWESTLQAMRAMPRTIKTEVSRRGKDLAEPLAKEIRSAGKAEGRHAARVADTVKSSMKAGIPAVTAGGSLPYVMGSEWGGRKTKKVSYTTHSPLGKSYTVRRRTTMQFEQHKGGQGYWFTPTVQEGRGRDVVLKAWAELVDDVIARF